ncbi:MAG: hypothetical protein ACKV0T_30470 [Planctomycetales bacterium]
MTTPITIKTKARFHRGRRGSKVLKLGEAATPAPRRGRVPRVARLFALAHRFETSIRESEVRDYADLGHATRARVTQFMNVLQLMLTASNGDAGTVYPAGGLSMSAIQFEAVVGSDQVIRPPEGIILPVGRIEVSVRTRPGEVPIPDPLAPTRSWLFELAAEAEAAQPQLPADMAENHDHYAHGAPRR